jgi:hypothetical protein
VVLCLFVYLFFSPRNFVLGSERSSPLASVHPRSPL